jgi:hypothetical protein
VMNTPEFGAYARHIRQLFNAQGRIDG